MELAIEAYIMENESVLKLDEDELSDPIVLDAEIALKEGSSSGNGRIDILVQYPANANTFAIVELKRDEINLGTLEQLTGYLKQRNELIKYLPEESQSDTIKKNWVGILVGRTICPKLKEVIEAKGLIDGTEIPLAAITINRYRGVEHKEIFVVTDTYFKEPNTKDYSKYNFKYNNEIVNRKPLNIPLSKGALVTEVIRHYVSQNKGIKFEKLRDEFPKDLQGTLECFDTLEYALEKKNNSNNRPYHRFGSSNVIELDDGTKIVTSNGWALGNIQRFIERAKQLGYNIKKISLG